MKRVYDFLKEAGTYYLATMDGDQPRVRPFGTVNIFEGKLYIQTGKGKAVAKQIAANPKVEICAMKGDEWIRVATTLVEDDRVEALIEVKVTPMRGCGFDGIAKEIAAHPEVKNLYLMSGAYDLAVIVESASLRAVSRFVSECISTYENVISTATHFILKKYKVEGALMEDEASRRLSVQP